MRPTTARRPRVLDVAAMMMHAMRAVKDASTAEGRRTDKAKYRIVRVTDASEGARGRRMSTLTDMMRSWQMDCCREGEGSSAFRFRSGALLYHNVCLAIVAYYRGVLYSAQITFKKDPGRARQNSLATAGTNSTKPGAQNKGDLCRKHFM